MLDHDRLLKIKWLQNTSWKYGYKFDVSEKYKNLNPDIEVQVPFCDIFQSAMDIIESLNGITLVNLHPELGLGLGYHDIEFDFFEYDRSMKSTLVNIEQMLHKKVLYFAKGYDDIGDWLIAEDGQIYFDNHIQQKIRMIAYDIYHFLELVIPSLQDAHGISIFHEY